MLTNFYKIDVVKTQIHAAQGCQWNPHGKVTLEDVHGIRGPLMVQQRMAIKNV
jgi:hypothetical protein